MICMKILNKQWKENMKKIKDLEVGDIVYGLNDYFRLKLFKVKEITGVKRYPKNPRFVNYNVVLIEMNDKPWDVFNLHSDQTEFDDDMMSLTYFLNKEDIKYLLNNTLNNINESFKLLEE